MLVIRSLVCAVLLRFMHMRVIDGHWIISVSDLANGRGKPIDPTFVFFPHDLSCQNFGVGLGLAVVPGLWHGHAATFYYVSVSKPNPVWFGKKSSNYWRIFPNQIQFGLENSFVKFGGKLIPNQIQFGLEKNAEHFSRQKSQTNSRLVWKYFFNYLNISDILTKFENVAISKRCLLLPKSESWNRFKMHKKEMKALQSFSFKGKWKLSFTFHCVFF